MRIKHTKIRLAGILTSLLIALNITSCAPMTSNSLRYDKTENKIVNQATGVGAGAGALAGYLYAKKNDKNRLQSAATGALVGGLLGRVVGSNQADKARKVRLKNQDMATFLAKSKANNNKLATYNKNLSNTIANIRSAKKSEQAKLARNARIAADRALVNTDNMIKDRKNTIAKLSGSQKSQAQSQLNTLTRERSTLARHKNTLVRIESITTR